MLDWFNLSMTHWSICCSPALMYRWSKDFSFGQYFRGSLGSYKSEVSIKSKWWAKICGPIQWSPKNPWSTITVYPDPLADSQGPPTANPEYLWPTWKIQMSRWALNKLLRFTWSFQFLGEIVKNHENHNVATFGCLGVLNQPGWVAIGFVRPTVRPLPFQLVILQTQQVIGSQSQLVDVSEQTIQITGGEFPLLVELQVTIEDIIAQVVTQSQIGKSINVGRGSHWPYWPCRQRPFSPRKNFA